MKRRILGLSLVVMLSAGCGSLRFKSTEEVRTMGEEAYSEERYEEAQPYFDELLRRDEEDVNARLKRGRSRDLTGNALAAREDYSGALEVNPEDNRARLYRGELAVRTNTDLASAEADFQAVMNSSASETTDRVIALKFLGVIQTKKNNLGGAETYFRQATTLGASSSDPVTLKHVAEAHYDLGQCLFLQKSFPESHDQFVLYSRLAPRVGMTLTPQDYYLLGITAYLSRDTSAAKTYFSKSDPQLRAKAARVLDDPTIDSKQFH